MDDLYIKYMDETYGLSGGGGSSVSITPSLSSGTKVADYTVDGVSDALYAPTPIDVEANPSRSGTADLTKLKVGSTTYDIPSGTEVVANPSGTASTDLTSIQIGNDIFSIPSGGGTGSSSITRDTLWTGVAYSWQVPHTGTLSKAISNYDYILLYGCGDDMQDELHVSILDVPSLLDGMQTNNALFSYEYYQSIYTRGKFTDETHFTITENMYLNSHYYQFTKMVGVKINNGGSDPTPVSNNGYYKETELYSSAYSSASIILNDDYTNYDALIFLNKYNSGGYILDSIVSTTGITEAANNNCQFRIHCGSDVAYIFGTVTSDTQFTLTMQNYFVTKVIGINYTKNRTKALIPKMTSATTPSGTVSASSYQGSTFYPYFAFDGANGGINTLTNTWLPASGETTSWIIYEFDELKLFESLKTRTGGSAASNNVVFDVEGRKADGTWENCLASGTDVTLSFPVYDYTYADTPLNGKQYNAIRLTSHSTMFVANQYGCGIDLIQVYGKNISN